MEYRGDLGWLARSIITCDIYNTNAKDPRPMQSALQPHTHNVWMKLGTPHTGIHVHVFADRLYTQIPPQTKRAAYTGTLEGDLASLSRLNHNYAPPHAARLSLSPARVKQLSAKNTTRPASRRSGTFFENASRSVRRLLLGGGGWSRLFLYTATPAG